jgi:hypothetical protein
VSYAVACTACSKQVAISSDVFTRCISGKKVSIRCRYCQQAMTVDGTNPEELAKMVVPGRTSPMEPAAPASARAVPPPPPPSAAQQLKVPPPLDRARASTSPHAVTRPPAARPATAPTTRAPRPAPNLQKTLLGMPAQLPPPPLAAPPRSSEPAPMVPDVTSEDLPTLAPPPHSEVGETPAAPEPAPPLALGRGALDDLTPGALVRPSEYGPPVSTAAVVRETRSTPARARRGLALAATAFVVVSGVALLFALKVGRAPAANAVQSQAAAPQAASPRAASPAASTLPSRPGPPEQTSTAIAPTPTQPAPSAQPTAIIVDEHGVPPYVKSPVAVHRTMLALRGAQRCHPGGHAVGTVDAFITFAANGHVIDARLEGEPLASAPVATCILQYARSVILPKFEGEPFTLRQSFTMR